MEALLAGGSKRDRDVAVLWTLGCQETEKLHTSGLTTVVVFNNEMNAILCLGCNCETRIHGIACHVGKFIHNGGMHGLVVTVDGENASFNCHGRKGGRQFRVVRNRQCQ